VLRFSPHAARWIAAETWHPAQADESQGDGGLIRRIPYRRSDELAMDILKYGADVEVIEPAALRKEIERRLRAALRVYEDAAQGNGQSRADIPTPEIRLSR
jgi:predicted DNA-binding transcriptional regulator YafY